MAHPALTPKWLVGHLLAFVAVVAFVYFGLWQLQRLDERQQQNAEVRANTAQSIEPVGEAQGAEWVRVSAVGTYQPEDQILVRSRSQDGISGYHVLTPLEYAPGQVLIVNRGFVPLGIGNNDVDGVTTEIPLEVVTVEGVLRATQIRGRLGPTDPPEGKLEKIARVDIARISQQLDAEVYDYWLQLSEQQPAQELYPVYVPLPELDEGPHLAYAVQWFTFALVVIIGYPVILRKAVKPLDLTTQS